MFTQDTGKGNVETVKVRTSALASAPTPGSWVKVNCVTGGEGEEGVSEQAGKELTPCTAGAQDQHRRSHSSACEEATDPSQTSENRCASNLSS